MKSWMKKVTIIFWNVHTFFYQDIRDVFKANSRIKTQKNHSYTDPNIDVTWSDCAHLIPADKNFVGGGGGNGVSDLFFRFFFFIFEVSIFGFNGESDSESDEDELL